MVYKIFADFTVLVHFLWILFLFIGAIWGRKYPGVKVFHIFGLGFALLLQIFDWICPLTHLETWFRSKHHPNLTYTGSFIIYYLEKIIYVEVTPPILQCFTLLLCGFNGWLYFKKRESRH